MPRRGTARLRRVESGRRQRDRSACQIHAAEWQTVRAELVQERRSTLTRRRAAAAIRTWFTSTTWRPKRSARWGPAGGGMWGRTGPAISSKGVMYTGTGDGPWDPENGVYGNGIIGVKQDPVRQSRQADGLLRPYERRMAVQARPGYAGHPRDLQIQRQGVDGGRGQGVPSCI